MNDRSRIINGKSISVSARLHSESEPGKIYLKWLDKGATPREVVEAALMLLEGVDPPSKDNLSTEGLKSLQRSVDRLENLARMLRDSGYVVTPEIVNEIGATLDSEFVQNLKKSVRPGFR